MANLGRRVFGQGQESRRRRKCIGTAKPTRDQNCQTSDNGESNDTHDLEQIPVDFTRSPRA